MGLPLTVRTEHDDAWVHGLVNQLNRRIDELRRAAPKANPQTLAVLVALNLAEELQGEKDKLHALQKDASTAVARALERVTAALSVMDDDEDSGAVLSARRAITAEA